MTKVMGKIMTLSMELISWTAITMLNQEDLSTAPDLRISA